MAIKNTLRIVKIQKYVFEIEKSIREWLQTEDANKIIRKIQTASSPSWVYFKPIYQRSPLSKTIYKISLEIPRYEIRRRLIINQGIPRLEFNLNLDLKSRQRIGKWLLWEEDILINKMRIRLNIIKEDRKNTKLWFNSILRKFIDEANEDMFNLNDTDLRQKSITNQYESLKSLQRMISSPYSSAKPSETTSVFWIYAKNGRGNPPKFTQRSGKWLIFVDSKDVDEVWAKIKDATEIGKLGDSAKVATAKPNPVSKNPEKKVICVYTYDWTDEKDVRRVREELRSLGIINKIPYKTDEDTLNGRYRIKGYTRISKYYE